MPEADAVDKKVIEQYNHILEIHAFYQELIEDVTNLPYLDDIFVEGKKYQLKEQYCP